MFQRLRERLFPPAAQSLFTDPILGLMTWHALREVWVAEAGPPTARHRFEIARLKPSPTPPAAALEVAHEMVGKLDFIALHVRGLLGVAASKAPAPAADKIRQLTIESICLRVEDGVVRGDILLTGPGAKHGWSFNLVNGMPMSLGCDNGS